VHVSDETIDIHSRYNFGNLYYHSKLNKNNDLTTRPKRLLTCNKIKGSLRSPRNCQSCKTSSWNSKCKTATPKRRRPKTKSGDSEWGTLLGSFTQRLPSLLSSLLRLIESLLSFSLGLLVLGRPGFLGLCKVLLAKLLAKILCLVLRCPWFFGLAKTFLAKLERFVETWLLCLLEGFLAKNLEKAELLGRPLDQSSPFIITNLVNWVGVGEQPALAAGAASVDGNEVLVAIQRKVVTIQSADHSIGALDRCRHDGRQHQG